MASGAIKRLGTGRTRRQVGVALRVCAALWLIFYIVYTPIHLYLEPHSDGADCRTSARPATAVECLAGSGHDGGENHDQHPATQHKFKVTQPMRAVFAEMPPVQSVESVAIDQGCPQPQVFEFSGLSPPELSCCWQFFFRTALPVRAPSLLS